MKGAESDSSVIPSGGTRRFFLTFASRTSRPEVEESLFDLPSVSCHGACPERSRTGIPPQPVIPRKSRCFLSGRRGIAASITASLAPNAVPLAMRHSWRVIPLALTSCRNASCGLICLFSLSRSLFLYRRPRRNHMLSTQGVTCPVTAFIRSWRSIGYLRSNPRRSSKHHGIGLGYFSRCVHIGTAYSMPDSW